MAGERNKLYAVIQTPAHRETKQSKITEPMTRKKRNLSADRAADMLKEYEEMDNKDDFTIDKDGLEITSVRRKIETIRDFIDPTSQCNECITRH